MGKMDNMTMSFAVLGNHDYRGNALAQLSPVLRKIDNRWFCRRSFILEAGKMTLVLSIFNLEIINDTKKELNLYTLSA